MRANDTQVGGDHYNKNEYQCWDFICDLNLNYLIGCATKYVSRWRNKNGIDDLKKAKHYIQKASEVGIQAVDFSDWQNTKLSVEYRSQLSGDDSITMDYILRGKFRTAIRIIDVLIREGE
jgi:hypothetical protein